MRVVAHRGASISAPENTMAAFEEALHAGADGVEFDVQMTIDDELIVIHDVTLDRTTTGSGFVDQTPWGTISALDAGSWFDNRFQGVGVPRLEDVLGLSSRGLELELELKGHGALFLDRVLDVIDRTAPEATIEFTSSNVWLLSRLRRLNPTATIGLFTQRPQPWMTPAAFEQFVLGTAETAEVQVVHVWAPAITESIAMRLHEIGLQVHANDADDTDPVRRAVSSGADRLSTVDVELAVAICG
jgi:glycerophosphoryl diester phosphodiesterase